MPHHASAPVTAQPMAGHRIAHALAAKGLGKTNLDKEILARAIRPTETNPLRGVATTGHQDSADRKILPNRAATGPRVLMQTTALHEAAVAKPAELAVATVDGVHDRAKGEY